VLASCSREPPDRNRGLEVERRRLLMSGLVSSFAIVLPISEAYAVMETDEDVKMNTQVDEINAYSFLYPVELPGKKFSFKWVESRKPERYSSAAPLSPDARQRIVSERVDMIHNVVISVSIGPPNSRFLPSKDKSSWDPKDVADCILSDRSTLKVTTGQRMTESSVLDAHATEVSSDHCYHPLRVLSFFGVDMCQYVLKIICRLTENHIGIMSILFGNHQQNLHQNQICFDTM